MASMAVPLLWISVPEFPRVWSLAVFCPSSFSWYLILPVADSFTVVSPVQVSHFQISICLQDPSTWKSRESQAPHTPSWAPCLPSPSPASPVASPSQGMATPSFWSSGQKLYSHLWHLPLLQSHQPGHSSGSTTSSSLSQLLPLRSLPPHLLPRLF